MRRYFLSKNLFFVLFSTTALLCVAASATAQPYDHLKCFKVRDPGTFKEATLDLDDTLFGAISGCVIKKKSKEFCIPVEKDVTAIEDGTDTPLPAQDQIFDRLCYKVKCPKTTLADQLLLNDQFGTRFFDKFKPSLICTPAVKGPAPVCGNDTTEPGETCDGLDDAACPGECSVSCLCPECGDSAVSPPEECDPPASQGGSDPLCNDDCTLSVCGDSTVGAGEECDPPSSGGGLATCNADCTLSVCGDAIVEAGEDCETNADCSGGDVCSGGCACLDSQCPDLVQLTLHAGDGLLATTATEVDHGWRGVVHDADLPGDVPLDLAIFSSAGSGPAACGESVIGGLDPAAGNCRCSNDMRTSCTEPFQPDVANCGGATCECFLAPPAPTSSGNVPVCTLTKLSEDITGSWNVDTGAANLALTGRTLMYLGDTLLSPCPTCDGDTTANDGIRDGVCAGGDNAGQSCDANGVDTTFPAPGGGAYSYDCAPDAGKNISGFGIPFDYNFGTGTQSLSAVNECGFPPFSPQLCPCGVCSDAPSSSTACSSNSDCGTCATNADCGTGECDGAGRCQCGLMSLGQPASNGCSDNVCTPNGGDEGVCLAGPIDTACDGILRANGEGIIACASNSDCSVGVIGIAAGNCTLSSNRECFVDPVSVSGAAVATSPNLASLHCGGPSSSAGVNNVYGFPGPVRILRSTSASYRCAGDPGSVYPACP